MKTTTVQLAPYMLPPDGSEPPERLGYEICGADRDDLRERFGNAEYVGLGQTQSLRLFSETELEKLLAYYDQVPPEKAMVLRPLLANMTQLKDGETGQLVLTDRLCAYAGLGEGAAVLAEEDDGSMFLCAPEQLEALEEWLRRRKNAS